MQEIVGRTLHSEREIADAAHEIMNPDTQLVVVSRADKGVVIIAFWGGLLAFILWLCHIWIKHTKYIGLCFVLVSLLYGGLYFFGDLKFI